MPYDWVFVVGRQKVVPLVPNLRVPTAFEKMANKTLGNRFVI